MAFVMRLSGFIDILLLIFGLIVTLKYKAKTRI